MPSRTGESGASANETRGVGHVLEQLHAGDDVVGAGGARGEVLGGDRFVRHRDLALKQVELCHLQRLLREIDAGHARAALRHGLGEDAAAASDIERRFPRERGEPVDPVQAQRIDLVQRLELALRVPPAVRERAEFFQFPGIGVHVRPSLALETKIKKPRRGRAL